MNDLTVIILTYNEEANIVACLDSLEGVPARVFVVDSYSTDRTIDLLQTRGICYLQHPFEHYAHQRNWAQANCPFDTEWVLHLDAGERCTPELVRWIRKQFDPRSPVDGFMFSRRTFFLDQWIRYGGHYPSYHLRLFRRSKGYCENKAYDQHFVVKGSTRKVEAGIDIIDIVATSISGFVRSHHRWALFEAIEIVAGQRDRGEVQARLTGTPIERRRWLKQRLFQRTPLFLRGILYFFYRYLLRLGFLDGSRGFVFHFLQGLWFRILIDAYVLELRRKFRKSSLDYQTFVSEHYGNEFLKAIPHPHNNL